MNERDLMKAVRELEEAVRRHKERKAKLAKGPHCPHHERFVYGCMFCLEVADACVK